VSVYAHSHCFPFVINPRLIAFSTKAFALRFSTSPGALIFPLLIAFTISDEHDLAA
jgi:hypothetical protein